MMLRRSLLWDLLVALVILVVGAGLVGWRLDAAPDVFTDEIVYARAGVRVADEGALVWDWGEPIYVHPPLYFLTEAAWFGLTGDAGAPLYVAGDIFALVYHARLLNAILAGVTGALLYLLGRRLRSTYLGFLLAALFFVDPFGLRTNRRAMLETMAALLTMGGMALFLTRAVGPRSRAWPWSIAAGFVLGAALLTKEITFTTIGALLLFGGWQAWNAHSVGGSAHQALGRLVPSLLVASTSLLTYSIYPLWMAGSGNWQGFVQVKSLSLRRLLGLVQTSGWNRPGLSLADFLLQRLGDYGSSLILLALGAVAAGWLLWSHRSSRTSRLLISWSVILYPFYGFVALFGVGNDQLFYYLLLPAIMLIGHAVFAAWDEIRTERWRKAGLAVGGLLLALLLTYNILAWWSAYGVGFDNAYYHFSGYVQERIPETEPINASGDALKFQYFTPDHPISTAATPAEAQALGITTFALAPKDVEARYGRMTQELADWITTNGRLLFSARGDSYGTVSLYDVQLGSSLEGESSTPPDVDAAQPRRRGFAPATASFVGGLLVALGLWCLGVVTFAATMWVWIRQTARARTDATSAAATGSDGGAT